MPQFYSDQQLELVNDPFDVAIVGAGLAGSALAIRLSKAGARVALLDAARFPRAKLCGEYLSPEGLQALNRLGLGDQIGQLGGLPIHRVRLTTPRGRSLESVVTRPNGDCGLGLSRERLDALLLDYAKHQGTNVLEETRVTCPTFTRGRVTGIQIRHRHGQLSELHARVFVAADGRHSSLARQVGVIKTRSIAGLRPSLFGLKRHFVVGDQAADEPTGTVGLHLLPGGYVGACRIDGGRTNLCGLLPDQLAKTCRGDLDALANSTFGLNPVLRKLWTSSEPAGPWKTVAGVRVQIATQLPPEVFAVGDARGTVDPLGGQGMTMALLSAELTTPFVLQALARREDTVDEVCKATRAWHHRFDRRVLICRAFHHALIQSHLIDLGALLGRVGQSILAFGFAVTRDSEGVSLHTSSY